jgi:site-specific recombinase XerD
MHDNGLHNLIEALKATAGLRDHANILPHSLRHACATRLMRNGADIRSIQAFLGHSQMTTTAQYLHTDEERLRDISELASMKPKTTRSEPPTRETQEAHRLIRHPAR